MKIGWIDLSIFPHRRFQKDLKEKKIPTKENLGKEAQANNIVFYQSKKPQQ